MVAEKNQMDTSKTVTDLSIIKNPIEYFKAVRKAFMCPGSISVKINI